MATIVHEATHQIAFNCGMQQRYADIPLWLCEGMAVYFEAPDLASKVRLRYRRGVRLTFMMGLCPRTPGSTRRAGGF